MIENLLFTINGLEISVFKNYQILYRYYWYNDIILRKTIIKIEYLLKNSPHISIFTLSLEGNL